MKVRYVLVLLIVGFFVYTSCEEEDKSVLGTAQVEFSFDQIKEVESATQALSITIGISTYEHAGGTLTVSISGGDYGTDFTTSSGSSTFDIEVPVGVLSTSFSIQPVDDDQIEQDKVLTIAITNATGSLELGEKTALTYTLLDDDDPLIATVAFENATAEIDENDTNALPLSIVFDQASTSGGTLTVNTSGDAILDTDYTIEGVSSIPFTIDIPGNATSANFKITPIDNTEFASDKTVKFILTEVSGGLKLGTQTESVVTILNDDAPPSPVIDFSNAAVSINEDASTLTVDFTISGTTSTDATAEISVNTSSTATLGSDFDVNGQSANPYILNIPSGSSSASLTLNITDDTETESDETVVLDITNTTGGLDTGLNIQQTTITIVDNDVVTPFSYVETFENTTSIDDLGYQTVLITQDLPATNVIKYNNKAANYSDVDDITLTSDNGMQIFYNITSDGEGIIDNMVITPVLQGSGTMNVSLDLSYITGLGSNNRNSAEVTIYWSDTYTGSGTFVASEWNIMEMMTAASLDAEGIARTQWSRRSHNINPTSDFYIAVRVMQVMNTDHDATQWRFDNIQVKSQ